MHNNISIIKDIIVVFIECIRARIMIEIGIDKNIIERYYNKIDKLEVVKYNIINDINEDDIIKDDENRGDEKVLNKLSKKDKDYVAELNAILGTRYRENEYDLENDKDFIEVIENVTAEYMDYMNYWSELSSIVENFDQSMEVFHPEKWFKMTIDGYTGSNLIEDTLLSVEEAADNMYNLAHEAEEVCKELWKNLLLGDKVDVQNYFLGNIKKYSDKKRIQALEEVIENVFYVKYENQVQNDTKNFAEELRRCLKG